MPALGHVIAVPPTPEELEPIRRELDHVGIRSEVRDPEPGPYLVEDTSWRDDVKASRHGLLLGFALGALVGLVLVLTVPFLRDLPLVGQVLLIGGIGLQGSLPVMMWAMGRVESYDEDAETMQEVGSDDQLVVVDSDPDEGRARRVLEHHHAVFLDEDHPHVLAA